MQYCSALWVDHRLLDWVTGIVGNPVNSVDINTSTSREHHLGMKSHCDSDTEVNHRKGYYHLESLSVVPGGHPAAHSACSLHVSLPATRLQ